MFLLKVCGLKWDTGREGFEEEQQGDSAEKARGMVDTAVKIGDKTYGTVIWESERN